MGSQPWEQVLALPLALGLCFILSVGFHGCPGLRDPALHGDALGGGGPMYPRTYFCSLLKTCYKQLRLALAR